MTLLAKLHTALSPNPFVKIQKLPVMAHHTKRPLGDELLFFGHFKNRLRSLTTGASWGLDPLDSSGHSLQTDRVRNEKTEENTYLNSREVR